MDHTGSDAKPAVLLLARSGISAAPIEEMTRLAAYLAGSRCVSNAVFAFTEQGSPTFREVLQDLVASGSRDILILPCMVPLEPSLTAWITRMVQRWQSETSREWPTVRISRGLSLSEHVGSLLDPMLESAFTASPLQKSLKATGDGSIVSDRLYRVLVCNGAPCTQAGASAIWSHLRQRQGDLKLADRGKGMRSAKTSCLGPCGLAPVVQVYPDGVFYGGVTEAGMDRIIETHLGDGQIVEELAYSPGPGKQTVRAAPSAISTSSSRPAAANSLTYRDAI